MLDFFIVLVYNSGIMGSFEGDLRTTLEAYVKEHGARIRDLSNDTFSRYGLPSDNPEAYSDPDVAETMGHIDEGTLLIDGLVQILNQNPATTEVIR